MALSTTDLPEGGGGLPKTMSVGNHTVKINSVYLDDFKFIPGAKHLMFNVETKPIEGFEGWLIDKNDESKGHHAGQTGRLKASQYAFADGTTKSGVPIIRDKSLMIFLKNLNIALGSSDWFIAQNDKHDTIEDFIDAFNNDAPFKDKFLDICIAGKEYEGKSGYTNQDLWIARGSKAGYAYTEEGGNVMKFSETEHLKKMEVKPVVAFDADDFSVPPRASSDFNLD